MQNESDPEVMPPKPRGRPPKVRRIFWVMGALALGGVFVLGLQVRRSMNISRHHPRIQGQVMQIKTAIGNYQTDYNSFPVSPGATETPIPTDATNPLVTILMGIPVGDLNPKEIRTLDAPIGMNNRGGLIDAGDGKWSLYDSWGNPYRVIMDIDYDNVIPNPDVKNSDPKIRSEAPPELPTQVMVYSAGPDGVFLTKDDIVSWR
ncbi:MAG: hypothetical protein H7A55_06695 [Verrucomicrobiaceae bacterium]|nr:hypothetical protein [Verrucomicrobiaceae bacterium]